MKDKKINSFVYLIFSILFLEIIIKVLLFKHFFNGLGSVILFSFFFIFLFTLITKLFNDKINKRILLILMIL